MLCHVRRERLGRQVCSIRRWGRSVQFPVDDAAGVTGRCEVISESVAGDLFAMCDIGVPV